MEEIAIRKGTILDLSVIQRLNQMLFENEEKWHPTYIGTWPFSERGTQYFTDRLNEVTGVIFVAEHQEKIVGYINGGWLRSYPFRKETSFIDLDNMYVLGEYRSKGIGEKLVNEFKNWAKTRGVEVIRVDSVYENDRAIDFYTKKGFKKHSVLFELNIKDN